MLGASVIGLLLVISCTSMLDYRRVHTALESQQLVTEMQRAIDKNRSLLDESLRVPGLCAVVLRSTVAQVFAAIIPNTQGPNRVSNALAGGRIFAQLRGKDDLTCSTGKIALADSNIQNRSEPGDSDDASGIVHVISTPFTTKPGSEIRYGMKLYSPLYAVLRNDDIAWKTIILYILGINFLSVSVMVPLLVRRIRRAEQAAEAWTLGEMNARINDPRLDEFGRLSHSFDRMADTLAGVIKVKQALAAADERNRLARDLHDTAKQRAFALGLQLTALKAIGPEDARWRPNTAASLVLVTQLQEDLAIITKRLAAPTIAERGFRHVLIDAAEALLSVSGLQWQLTMTNDSERTLSAYPLLTRELLFIIIEATANALKHAGARTLTYTINAEGAICYCVIADDGRGFNVAAAGMAGNGMGLSNMRLRADALPGGTLALQSSEAGTTITVAFHVEDIAER